MMNRFAGDMELEERGSLILMVLLLGLAGGTFAGLVKKL
jgi:hypothetical protein